MYHSLEQLVTSSTDLCPKKLSILEYIMVSLATQNLNSSATISVYRTGVLRINSFLNRCNLLERGVHKSSLYLCRVST